MRRECLDCMIPLNERHLYGIVKEWVTHYNATDPTWHWDRAFHSHLHLYRFLCTIIGIGCRRLSAWKRVPSSGACTMTIGWGRRRHEDGRRVQPHTCDSTPIALRRTP
jgi:hypothetical protein